MVARPWGVLNRHKGFKNIGLPFTVENSIDNNPIQTIHSKSVHTTCMVSNHYCRTFADCQTRWTAQCDTCVIVKDVRASAERWLAPNEFWYRKIEQLIPITTAITDEHRNTITLSAMERWELRRRLISHQRASNKGVKILNTCFPS